MASIKKTLKVTHSGQDGEEQMVTDSRMDLSDKPKKSAKTKGYEPYTLSPTPSLFLSLSLSLSLSHPSLSLSLSLSLCAPLSCGDKQYDIYMYHCKHMTIHYTVLLELLLNWGCG